MVNRADGTMQEYPWQHLKGEANSPSHVKTLNAQSHHTHTAPGAELTWETENGMGFGQQKKKA
jgi:hypothetical protein